MHRTVLEACKDTIVETKKINFNKKYDLRCYVEDYKWDKFNRTLDLLREVE